ncbi:hypothetical protein ACFL60_03265 [Candidatus Omnitrophota bacterium]
MWKILKAEFSYNRYWFLTALTAHLVLLLVFAVKSFMSGEIEYRAIPVISFLMGDITFALMVFVLIFRETSRGRLIVKLPVPVRDIAMVRLLTGILFWLLLLVVYGLFLLLARLDTLVVSHKTFESNLLFDLLAITGCLFILNAIYHISRDLSFSFRRSFTVFSIPLEQVPSILLSLFIGMMFFFMTVLQLRSVEPLRTTILSAVVSPSGAIILACSGLLLSCLSVVIYIRRRTFLA